MSEETILLIDLDSATEQKAVSALESEGYVVFTAAGKDTAIQLAKKVPPSLICIDPASSGGLETCKELHGKPFLRNVSIIIITAFGGSMDPRYTTTYGIVDFLKTAFTEKEFIQKVRDALKKGMPEIQSEEEEPFIATEEVTSPLTEERENEREKRLAHDYSDLPDTDIVDMPEVHAESDRPIASARSSRRRPRTSGNKSRFLVPVLVLLIITAVGTVAGRYSYQLFRQKAEEATSLNSPPPPVQPETAKPAPVPEQSPLQPAQPSEEKSAPDQISQEPASDKSMATVTVEKPAGKAVYSVQTGAFKNEQNAEMLAQKIRDQGYEAFVRKGQSKDRETVYRVLIGKYSEKKDVVAISGQIESKLNIKVTLFSE